MGNVIKILIKPIACGALVLAVFLSATGAPTDSTMKLVCEGNVEFNGIENLQQPISMSVETRQQDQNFPRASWNWNDVKIDLAASDFQYANENVYTWHQSEHKVEEERVQTRLMLRFDRNDNSYILIQNNPDKLFSQGICHELGGPMDQTL